MKVGDRWRINSWVADRVWNFKRVDTRYQLVDPTINPLARIVFEHDVGAGLGLNQITWQDHIPDMICSAVCERFLEKKKED
jgi:hypothetical protein